VGAHRNFSREGQKLGDMASVECKPITGSGAEPPVGSRGREGAKPPEAQSFEAFSHLKKAQKAVQGGCRSIFQPSGGRGQVLPLPMSMGAHGK